MTPVLFSVESMFYNIWDYICLAHLWPTLCTENSDFQWRSAISENSDLSTQFLVFFFSYFDSVTKMKLLRVLAGWHWQMLEPHHLMVAVLMADPKGLCCTNQLLFSPSTGPGLWERGQLQYYTWDMVCSIVGNLVEALLEFHLCITRPAIEPQQ